MDYFANIPHADALIDAVRVASLDVGAQVEWLERTGFHLDEISLQIGDFYYPVRGFIEDSDEFDFPEGVEDGIVSIMGEVARVNELDFQDDSPNSVLSSTGWNKIRVMAKDLMVILRGSEWSGLVVGE